MILDLLGSPYSPKKVTLQLDAGARFRLGPATEVLSLHPLGQRQPTAPSYWKSLAKSCRMASELNSIVSQVHETSSATVEALREQCAELPHWLSESILGGFLVNLETSKEQWANA